MPHHPMAILSGLLVCLSLVLIEAEIRTDSGQQNKPSFKVLDKDLEDAKERWIPNVEEDDWDEDDMMQHPIDEGPRRVSHRRVVTDQ